jgi:hypothetical protein
MHGALSVLKKKPTKKWSAKFERQLLKSTKGFLTRPIMVSWTPLWDGLCLLYLLLKFLHYLRTREEWFDIRYYIN